MAKYRKLKSINYLLFNYSTKCKFSNVCGKQSLLQKNQFNTEEQIKTISFDPKISKYNLSTPAGEKKDITCPLPDSYNPEYVEAIWYDWWEKQNFFKLNKSLNDRFVMCLPPPNITGQLHLGHALTVAIEDALVRWNRMNGKQVLWIPGCDHAGIATQMVIEKKIWKEKKMTRHDIGRNEFINEVWKWKKEKGDEIIHQLRLLGATLDWDRFVFTMDEKHSEGVNEAFVRLHDEGLIYRDKQLVNWCCHLQSTISDIEVEHLSLNGRTYLSVPGYDDKIEFGTLTSFAYPLTDNSNEIVVSTTRVETMLGDVAIAVHPEDERYLNLHGKLVQHPFLEHCLPIICDESVVRNCGTGAVKITPAHNINDYKMALRHNLDPISVINKDGILNENCGQFQGLKRLNAKKIISKLLEEKGLFRDKTSHKMNLPLCSRSGDIVEHLILPQWFLNCSAMAKLAIQAVLKKQLILFPSNTEKLWFHWLKNINDWCLSRQLWWGHQIPVYKIKSENLAVQNAISSLGGPEVWVSGRSKEEALQKASAKLSVDCSKIILEQDDDVLDTWFSSALFPLTVCGWPNINESFHYYYPLSLMETGHDILFFWVARMAMLGLKLTNQLPFNQILLHSLIKDAHGRKMSKSIGNVVDPKDVIVGISFNDLQQKLLDSNLSSSNVEILKTLEKDFPKGIPECGTDALRFSLCSYDTKAFDLNLDINLVHHYRTFCNKIWQGAKFIFNNISTNKHFCPASLNHIKTHLSVMDLWILHHLTLLIENCRINFNTYDLYKVTKALHIFWYSKFCDVYIECVKLIFQDGDPKFQNSTCNILVICLDIFLRCLAPFMPYITEELYQRLLPLSNSNSPSICIAPYPTLDEINLLDDEINKIMELSLELATEIRKIIVDFNVSKFHPDVFIMCNNDNLLTALRKCSVVFHSVSRSKKVIFVSNSDEIPKDYLQKTVKDATIHVKLKEYINISEELTKFQKKLLKLEQSLRRLNSQLDNSQLTPSVVLSLQSKKQLLSDNIKECSNAIDFLQNK